ncbi:NUDIX_hydrolase-like domain superfamily [Hexamita inflata]|uniref:NUDIX hydrolase-like domain superfamily n=1 Tax=Hexamita inflata TaxID=28002 RepID=A0AA86TVG4_9EUKA|nr:NUDIX hydrolase-like domain superfamily [Hexamita inflata]
MTSCDQSILSNPKLIADLKIILENPIYRHITKNIYLFSLQPQDLIQARLVNGGLRQLFWALKDQFQYQFNECDVQLIFLLIIQLKQLPQEKQMLESFEKQYDLPYFKVGAMILTNQMKEYVVVQALDHFHIDKNIRQKGFFGLPKGSVDFNDIENFEQKRIQLKNRPYHEQIALLCDDQDAKIKAVIREVKEETNLDISKEMILDQLSFDFIKHKKFPRKPRGEDRITLFFINYQMKTTDSLKAQSDQEIQRVQLNNFDSNFKTQTFGKLSVWQPQLQNIRTKVAEIQQQKVREHEVQKDELKENEERITETPAQITPQLQTQQYQQNQLIYDQQMLYWQQQMLIQQQQLQYQHYYNQQSFIFNQMYTQPQK